jgi:hypothetical protein
MNDIAFWLLILWPVLLAIWTFWLAGETLKFHRRNMQFRRDLARYAEYVERHNRDRL